MTVETWLDNVRKNVLEDRKIPVVRNTLALMRLIPAILSLEEVTRIHQPVPNHEQNSNAQICRECWRSWPCATRVALEHHLR